MSQVTEQLEKWSYHVSNTLNKIITTDYERKSKSKGAMKLPTADLNTYLSSHFNNIVNFVMYDMNNKEEWHKNLDKLGYQPVKASVKQIIMVDPIDARLEIVLSDFNEGKYRTDNISNLLDVMNPSLKDNPVKLTLIENIIMGFNRMRCDDTGFKDIAELKEYVAKIFGSMPISTQPIEVPLIVEQNSALTSASNTSIEVFSAKPKTMRSFIDDLNLVENKAVKHILQYCDPNVMYTPSFRRIIDVLQILGDGKCYTIEQLTNLCHVSDNCMNYTLNMLHWLKLIKKTAIPFSEHYLNFYKCGYADANANVDEYTILPVNMSPNIHKLVDKFEQGYPIATIDCKALQMSTSVFHSACINLYCCGYLNKLPENYTKYQKNPKWKEFSLN